jgi:lambda repressor-like predicted transcriptional regulator
MNLSELQNKYGVQLTLELIQTSKSFYEVYIKEYPDNTANALSYSKNPNCSCRNKLTKHYNENKQKVDSFVANFLGTSPNAINLAEFEQRHKTKPVSGRIVRIEKTDEAYGKLVSTIQNEGWTFRQMSVAVDGNEYVFFFV